LVVSVTRLPPIVFTAPICKPSWNEGGRDKKRRRIGHPVNPPWSSRRATQYDFSPQQKPRRQSRNACRFHTLAPPPPPNNNPPPPPPPPPQARLASVPELGVFRLALQAREWNARPASHGQERGGAGDTGGGGAAATGGKGGSAGAPAASGASGSSTAVDFVSLLSTYREVQRAHETKLLRQALRGGAGGGGAGAERGGAVGRGGAAVFDPAA
jgi:hypothetical protein